MKTTCLKMNRLFVPAFGLALALLGSVSEVLALDNNSLRSTDVWPAEGNGNCNDYFDNDVVKEANSKDLFGDANPGPGATGPANPIDPDNSDPETIDFSINADGTAITSFSASTRINAVILKASRKINVFVEPAGGVIDDLNIALDSGEEIDAVAFCYGVSYFEPEELVTLPACITDGDADACENEEEFECDIDINDTTGIVDIDCCACATDGETVFVCDPNLPLGVEGACNFDLKSFKQVLFGKNGNVACYSTDSGDRCYSYTSRR